MFLWNVCEIIKPYSSIGRSHVDASKRSPTFAYVEVLIVVDYNSFLFNKNISGLVNDNDVNLFVKILYTHLFNSVKLETYFSLTHFANFFSFQVALKFMMGFRYDKDLKVVIYPKSFLFLTVIKILFYYYALKILKLSRLLLDLYYFF